jgi:hypothetical protein
MLSDFVTPLRNSSWNPLALEDDELFRAFRVIILITVQGFAWATNLNLLDKYGIPVHKVLGGTVVASSHSNLEGQSNGARLARNVGSLTGILFCVIVMCTVLLEVFRKPISLYLLVVAFLVLPINIFFRKERFTLLRY